MYLLHDSELSDQGAVCLQAHQILRRPETKSKHTEVPFQIHLRNGRAVCCVHALTLFFVLLQPFMPLCSSNRSILFVCCVIMFFTLPTSFSALMRCFN